MIETQVESSETVWDVFGFNKPIELAVAGFPTLGAARRKNLTRGRRGRSDSVTIEVPRGRKVEIDRKPSDDGNTPSSVRRSNGGTPPSSLRQGGGNTSPNNRQGGNGVPSSVRQGGETLPSDNKEEQDANVRTNRPAEVVTGATGNQTENKTSNDANEANASNNVTVKKVNPGEVELPNVLTDEYEMIEGNSHSTLIDISDGDLAKIVPEDKLSIAYAAINRWNSLPVDMRRNYLLAESDEESGMDADSLDVAKTLEAFGVIKSNHSNGELAEGIKAAPEHSAHAGALEKVDPDAHWAPDMYPDFKDTIGLYTDGDIRINVTDDQIRQLAHNPIMEQSEIDKVRSALAKWNLAYEEEQRRILANSNYRSEDISEEELENLENLGLIKRENARMTFVIKDSKGESLKFSPSFERSVNNISAFKPASGRAA
jgi:hypothetical protein